MSTSQPTRLVRGHAGRALREIAGTPILPAKTIGTAGEQFFAYRALEEGLHVAQPLGDNLPYDLLVDSGLEILRLQIKTTTTEVEGKPGKFGFVLQHGGNGSSYQDGTVDFFGLVVLPLTTIYIVPQSSMNGRVKAYVYPGNTESAGLLERYRENWGLL